MSTPKKLTLFFAILLSLSLILSLPSCITGPVEATAIVSTSSTHSIPQPTTSLKVMSLNLAHGRKDGFHQFFQSDATILSHLREIATVLEREKPDVVAAQEADGPSFWSGNFSHVDYLANTAKLGYWVRGEHVKGLGLSYGTAVLSKWPLLEAVSKTFRQVPPTPAKGFVVSTVQTTKPIQVVSVHLDFARASLRQQQVAEMVNYLKPRGGPWVIMGDFNCNWGQEETLPKLVKELNLQAFRPEATDLNTFPQSSPRSRIDWILISSELQFGEYRTLTDTLSDHLGVVAWIQL